VVNNKTHTSAFNLVKSPSNPIFAAKTIVPSVVPLSGLRTPSPTNESAAVVAASVVTPTVNVANQGIIPSIQVITPPSNIASTMNK
jgi:hypothetical protein